MLAGAVRAGEGSPGIVAPEVQHTIVMNVLLLLRNATPDGMRCHLHPDLLFHCFVACGDCKTSWLQAALGRLWVVLGRCRSCVACWPCAGHLNQSTNKGCLCISLDTLHEVLKKSMHSIIQKCAPLLLWGSHSLSHLLSPHLSNWVLWLINPAVGCHAYPAHIECWHGCWSTCEFKYNMVLDPRQDIQGTKIAFQWPWECGECRLAKQACKCGMQPCQHLHEHWHNYFLQSKTLLLHYHNSLPSPFESIMMSISSLLPPSISFISDHFNFFNRLILLWQQCFQFFQLWLCSVHLLFLIFHLVPLIDP